MIPSPAQVECQTCKGNGRIPPDWVLCPVCDGRGFDWAPGGPLFGCKMQLRDRKPGEVVTLGTGDIGRIIRHDKRKPPATAIALFGVFDGVESDERTYFPSETGVASVSSPAWMTAASGGRDREDVLDPLRKQKP
jgi:RecJ-like exonuclease